MLRAARGGAGAELSWTPGHAAGYDVYRFDDKRQLADLARQPVELSVADPPGPVLMPPASGDRDLVLFHVLGR